jgi:hypothetical protein
MEKRLNNRSRRLQPDFVIPGWEQGRYIAALLNQLELIAQQTVPAERVNRWIFRNRQQ